jgi:tRNA threonylcarbamoyladenosine biosynthesis protein TsaB
MNARRNQVYNALFESDGSTVKRLCPDRALSIDELDEELSTFEKPIFLCGDGYSITEKGLKKTKVGFVHERSRLQSAYSVACCALEKYKLGEVLTDSEIVPIYLRPSQAERERNERLGLN